MATTIRRRRTIEGGSWCGTATLTIPRRISTRALVLGRLLTSVIGAAPLPRKRVGVPPAAQRRGGVPPHRSFALHRRRRGSCETHLRCQGDQNVQAGPQRTGDGAWDEVYQP